MRIGRLWNNQSMATKLVVILVLVALVPLTAVTLYNNAAERADLTQATHTQSLARAQATAHAIDQSLDEVQAEVRQVAWEPAVIVALQNPQDVAARDAAQVWLSNKEEAEAVGLFYLLGLKGDVQVASQERLAGRNYAAQSFFRSALEGRSEIDEPRYDAYDGQVYISQSAPVRTVGGQTVGVAVARVPMAELDRVIALDSDARGMGEFGVLWDEQGIILATGSASQPRYVPLAPLPPAEAAVLEAGQRFGPRTPDLIQQAGQLSQLVPEWQRLSSDPTASPYLNFRSPPDGQSMHAAIALLEAKHWTYAIWTPEANIQRALSALTRRALFVALGAALAAVLVAVFVSQLVSRPILAIASATRAVAAGDMSQRLGLRQGGELGQLMDGFDAMAVALQDKEDQLHAHASQLEQTVQRRTEELQQRVLQLETLHRASLSFSRLLDPQSLGHLVIDFLHELVDYDYGSILLVDEDGDKLDLLAVLDRDLGPGSDLPPERVAALRARRNGFRIGHGIVGWVAQTGQSVRQGDVGQDPHYVGVCDDSRSELCVPLRTGDRVVGVLNLESRQLNAYSADQQVLLETFATPIAVAVQNARLYQRERQHATELEQQVAERLRMEEALRAGEARYRHLFKDSPISMLEVDLSPVKRSLAQAAAAGIYDWAAYFAQYPERVTEALAGLRVLDVNKATVELYQADSREAMLDSGTFAVPLLRLEGLLPFLEHLAQGHSRWEGELVDRTLPNQPRHLFVTWQAFPGFEDTCEHTVLSCIDVTEARRAEQERQKLEQQLRQAQKMEAIGLLAGGVAHDFNNLLTVILGNLELGLQQLPPLNETLRQQLDMAQQAGQRAATLTQQLLAFGRRQILEVQDVDINALITNLSRMLGRMIGEHIEVQVVTDPHAGLVVADRSALEQIVMNLVVNARDAMPPERGTGSLRVSTERVRPDPAYVGSRLEAAEAGQSAALKHAPRPTTFVRLSVADTGTGMSAETQARLFEPFFTTKEAGKGTGLGLSVVYGLVRQHGGWIDVQSQVGQGTRFDVYLPAQQGLASAATDPHALQGARLATPGGTERILLAEDQEAVCEFTRTSLERLGYSVVAVSDGAQAVQAFAADAQGFDLLILDALMPHMTGQQACQAIRKLRPDARVLYLTGYNVEMADLPVVATEGVGLLKKPFSVDDLARHVRHVLEMKNTE